MQTVGFLGLPQTGHLQQQKFILLLFQSLDIRNQSIGKTMLPSFEGSGKTRSLPHPAPEAGHTSACLLVSSCVTPVSPYVFTRLFPPV